MKKKVNNLTFLLFIFFLLILFSGERKALAIFLFLVTMHYSSGNILKIIFISSVGIFFVSIIVYTSQRKKEHLYMIKQMKIHKYIFYF